MAVVLKLPHGFTLHAVSFMLRVYAMLGLTRAAFVTAGGLGLIGASTIALDIVSLSSNLISFYTQLTVESGKIFKSPA